MNGNGFIESIGGLDEALIQEASAIPSSRKRHIRSRWLSAAACLVLLFGFTAYATDMFGIRFSDTPREGSMTITSDGVTNEYKTFNLDAAVPTVKPKYIKGDVNDLAPIIKNNIEAAGKGEFKENPPHTYQHIPELYFVNDLSPEEAAKYIGYEYLEPVWFPYDTYDSTITVGGDAGPGGFGLTSIRIHYYNKDWGQWDNWFLIRSEVWFHISKTDSEVHTGIGWTEKDNHYTITSKNGYECHIIEYSEKTSGESMHGRISGTVIKNGLVYLIDMEYSENNRPEAQRVVREWAEHF